MDLKSDHRILFVLITLTIVFLSLSAVSAIETSNNTHVITESNYASYFNENGTLINPEVYENDIIDLNGNFTNKSFIFQKSLNITSKKSNAYLYDCIIKFENVNESSYISNLKIVNHEYQLKAVFIENSKNVEIFNNRIETSGIIGFPVTLISSRDCIVYNNNLRTYSCYDNNSWHHSGIFLGNSNNNYIKDNIITVEDSNGIYLGYGNGKTCYNNVISNNTITSTLKVPTAWTYGIKVEGGNNIIQNNRISNVYRGISAEGDSNQIIGNLITNITGIDTNSSSSVFGGDYAIYGSINAIIANNYILNSFVSVAGIYVGTNNQVFNNYIEITSKFNGLKVDKSNCNIYNNTIIADSGKGIYAMGNMENITILNNSIKSEGIGILFFKQSQSKKPSKIRITGNSIITDNDCAIDLAECVINSTIVEDNLVFGKSVILPQKDPQRNSSEVKGNRYIITDGNFNDFFTSNGELKYLIEDNDILEFVGDFTPKGEIILSKSVSLIGNNAVIRNTTIHVIADNCLIKSIKIINNDKSKSNLWGIYVDGANNIKIIDNDIYVWDLNSAYGIYLFDSKNDSVLDNNITSEGKELVFTVLGCEIYNCTFINNRILTVGTDVLHLYVSEICFDGVHSIAELSKTYGILLTYSSSNYFYGNDIEVTSNIKNLPVIYDESVNILYGVYYYYECHKNNFTHNTINVHGMDPFLYGLGCSGDDTDKNERYSRNNEFSYNNISVKAYYYANGVMLRKNSVNTTLLANNISLDAFNFTYGICLELTKDCNILDNDVSGNAYGNYGVQLFSSSGNFINKNTVTPGGSFTEPLALYSSNGNTITSNNFVGRGDKKNNPGMGDEHPDVVPLENYGGGIYKSQNNIIEGNTFDTDGEWGVFTDNYSKGNSITNNNIKSAKYEGNNAVKTSKSNTVRGNTKINSEVPVNSTTKSEGSSSAGKIGFNIANANSGSGVGESGVASYEINEVNTSVSSTQTVSIAILVLIAIFCFGFFTYRNRDDEEDE